MTGAHVVDGLHLAAHSAWHAVLTNGRAAEAVELDFVKWDHGIHTMSMWHHSQYSSQQMPATARPRTAPRSKSPVSRPSNIPGPIICSPSFSQGTEVGALCASQLGAWWESVVCMLGIVPWFVLKTSAAWLDTCYQLWPRGFRTGMGAVTHPSVLR